MKMMFGVSDARCVPLLTHLPSLIDVAECAVRPTRPEQRQGSRESRIGTDKRTEEQVGFMPLLGDRTVLGQAVPLKKPNAIEKEPAQRP